MHDFRKKVWVLFNNILKVKFKLPQLSGGFRCKVLTVVNLMKNPVLYDHHHLNCLEFILAPRTSPFPFHRPVLHCPGPQYLLWRIEILTMRTDHSSLLSISCTPAYLSKQPSQFGLFPFRLIVNRRFDYPKGRRNRLGNNYCLTYISYLLQKGIPSKQVRELAGHFSLSITDRYTHALPSN